MTIKTIEVSEDALDSVKAMAQKLQEERDMLLAALKDVIKNNDLDEECGVLGYIKGSEAWRRWDEARKAIAKVEQG